MNETRKWVDIKVEGEWITAHLNVKTESKLIGGRYEPIDLDEHMTKAVYDWCDDNGYDEPCEWTYTPKSNRETNHSQGVINRHRVAFLVQSERWMYDLGRAPVTKFSLCIQVWSVDKEPVCKIFYDLTSEQFIKARDLQNRLVGFYNAMPVPASDEDHTGVADWRTKCKNCGEPLGDGLECDSCGYDNIPF